MHILRKWGIPVLLLLAVGTLVGYGIHRRNQFKKGHVFVELKPFKAEKGWGYDIVYDGKLYIHQDIVPAISSHGYGFRTKEDALAVGRKVYERVLTGGMPMVSAKEITAMGIAPADSLQH